VSIFHYAASRADDAGTARVRLTEVLRNIRYHQGVLMATITRTGLPVYDHQPGEGPALVFLHYWGGAARTWRPVIDLLPGRATVSIEARGWGRSRELPGPYTLEQHAQDVLDVTAHAGLGDYILVGHSMGAKVAQLVAASRPTGLAGLALVGPAPAKPAAAITPEYREMLSHAYDSDETVAGARDAVLTATPLSEEIKAQIVADSRAAAGEARAEWPLHGIAADISGRTRAIEVPAVVIAGEHDRVEPADVLRENLLPYLAHAELHVIARTGHLIPLEAPVELARILQQALPGGGRRSRA
jgi:pimeloyl-ACP methyl ester carboxylesterase